jgi:hypothetical protein
MYDALEGEVLQGLSFILLPTTEKSDSTVAVAGKGSQAA